MSTFFFVVILMVVVAFISFSGGMWVQKKYDVLK